jgi:hypothetical protein
MKKYKFQNRSQKNSHSCVPLSWAFCPIFLLVQVGLGFLSDVENMGMYEGEMQDGQPHGNGTIGKDNMFRSTKIIHCIGALIVNNNGTDQVAIRINNYFSVYLSNDKFGRANYSGEWRYICSNTVNFLRNSRKSSEKIFSQITRLLFSQKEINFY